MARREEPESRTYNQIRRAMYANQAGKPGRGQQERSRNRNGIQNDEGQSSEPAFFTHPQKYASASDIPQEQPSDDPRFGYKLFMPKLVSTSPVYEWQGIYQKIEVPRPERLERPERERPRRQQSAFDAAKAPHQVIEFLRSMRF